MSQTRVRHSGIQEQGLHSTSGSERLATPSATESSFSAHSGHAGSQVQEGGQNIPEKGQVKGDYPSLAVWLLII